MFGKEVKKNSKEIYSPEEDVSKTYSPRESLVKEILDFAKSYDTLETVSTGYVEINLN